MLTVFELLLLKTRCKLRQFSITARVSQPMPRYRLWVHDSTPGISWELCEQIVLDRDSLRLVRMLVVKFSNLRRLITKLMCRDPLTRIVGLSSPSYEVHERMNLNLGVYDAFDEMLWLSVNNDRVWRWRLIALSKSIRVKLLEE